MQQLTQTHRGSLNEYGLKTTLTNSSQKTRFKTISLLFLLKVLTSVSVTFFLGSDHMVHLQLVSMLQFLHLMQCFWHAPASKRFLSGYNCTSFGKRDKHRHYEEAGHRSFFLCLCFSVSLKTRLTSRC